MADDKIKIYGELESGVPDGKVVDIRQVGMGELTIDPESGQITKSARGLLGSAAEPGFEISSEYIGFLSPSGGLRLDKENCAVYLDGVDVKPPLLPEDITNVGFVTTKIAESLKSLKTTFPTVTTYPYPSTRNILVEPERFVGIWTNITIPARSEVYARVTMNLNESSTEGHLICVGFVADAKTVASTAAPLPAVAAVEHSMCLSHWFEEETTLSVMVHSTTTAYVTDVVNPIGAAMAGGTELIVKTYA